MCFPVHAKVGKRPALLRAAPDTGLCCCARSISVKTAPERMEQCSYMELWIFMLKTLFYKFGSLNTI